MTKVDFSVTPPWPKLIQINA